MAKLTYEDKINIYIDKKGGMSIGSLSNKYKVNKNIINYLTALIDKHGIDILRTNRNTDLYCRNCGCRLKSNTHYILINIGTIIAFALLLFVILLFVAAYIVD